MFPVLEQKRYDNLLQILHIFAIRSLCCIFDVTLTMTKPLTPQQSQETHNQVERKHARLACAHVRARREAGAGGSLVLAQSAVVPHATRYLQTIITVLGRGRLACGRKFI
jgi:hypothetical protein